MNGKNEPAKGGYPCGIRRKDNHISVSDQYENLWRCRDFELSHLWQRMVFLQALLLLCFSGYGSLLLKVFDSDSVFKMCSSGEWRVWLDFIAIVLASLSILVSIFWIMMAKASKLWYERYERAIGAFVAYDGHRYVDSALKNGSETWAGFEFHKIKGYKAPKSDKALETTNGGRYSPSRLNVAIGQLSLIVWMFVASGHLADLIIVANLPKWSDKMALLACCLAGSLALVTLTVWMISKFVSREKGVMAAGSSYE